MDIVTHAITGALFSATIFPASRRRQTAFVGAVGASAPDLDVLISSSADPLLVLEYHRHFTHSLFFAPVGAALVALLLWPVMRKRVGGKALYIAAFIGYVSACLLDVFTSYGTHLLWPVVPHPVALNMIAVVDPLFTLLLSVGLFALLRSSGAPLAPPNNPVSLPTWLRGFGIIAGAAYLGMGAFQLYRAEHWASEWAAEQQWEAPDILVKPTLGNLLLWRAIITTNDHVQVLAVRPGLRAVQLYPGQRARLLHPSDLGLPLGSRALKDVERFYRFADGYLVSFPDSTEQFGDVRYAMLPTSVTPLWGISVNRNDADSAAEFFTQRDSSPATRQIFLRMLTGKPLHDTLPH